MAHRVWGMRRCYAEIIPRLFLALLGWALVSVLSVAHAAAASATSTPIPSAPPTPADRPSVTPSPAATPAPPLPANAALAPVSPSRAGTPTVSAGSAPAQRPADAVTLASPSPSPSQWISPVAAPAARATPFASQLAALEPAASDPAPEETPTEDADAEPDWRAFVPTDTADHLATMDRAARESGCGVPWHLLAAIARVESNFGRNMATSSAGAIGYGQFLPSSWRAFGNDGNVYDYRDALPAIATYLCQSGLARDPRAALFAYNHADWYVDLVLDLAVRYDRMAPGAPTPDVLDVGPAVDVKNPLRYASGRDLKAQSSRRSLPDASASWLGVPWRGRAPGAAISRTALETTAISMLRASFGLPGDPVRAEAGVQAHDALSSLKDRAWASGLLPYPRGSSSTAAETGGQWNVADIRGALASGHPVTVLVAASRLPGHAGLDAEDDQPLVVMGTTANGFIYSDPSFSSSLGYGLEMDEATLVEAWSDAATPFDAIAVARRPQALEPRLHAIEPVFPPLLARVVPTLAPAPQAGTAVQPVEQSDPPPLTAGFDAIAGDAPVSADDLRQTAPANAPSSPDTSAHTPHVDGWWATAIALTTAVALSWVAALRLRRSRFRVTS